MGFLSLLEVIMFTIDYVDFVVSSFYTDYSVSYMPGLTSSLKTAKVVVNVDSETAFVYCE